MSSSKMECTNNIQLAQVSVKSGYPTCTFTKLIEKMGNLFLFFLYSPLPIIIWGMKSMKPDAPADSGEGKDDCLFGLRFKLLIRIPDMILKPLVTAIFGILDPWVCLVSCAFFHDQNNQSVLILDTVPW